MQQITFLRVSKICFILKIFILKIEPLYDDFYENRFASEQGSKSAKFFSERSGSRKNKWSGAEGLSGPLRSNPAPPLHGF